MEPASVFTTCNAIAAIGWLVLIILPGWRSSDKFIIGIIVTLFAVIYTYYIVTNLPAIDMRNFSSLQGVTNLFTNPLAVLIGWVHYLAFDLMVGLFIKKNAKTHGIRHGWLIPCLLLTFMFGPVGILLYLLIRVIITRNYFADNF